MLELDAELTKEINVSYYHIRLNSKEYKSYSNRIIIYGCKKKVKLYCEICEKGIWVKYICIYLFAYFLSSESANFSNMIDLCMQ